MTMSRDQNAQEPVGGQKVRVGSKKSVQQGLNCLAASRRALPLCLPRPAGATRCFARGAYTE